MNLTVQKNVPITIMETRGITRFLAVLAAVGLLLPAAVHAGSATWELMPTSGDWNTAINWTPPTVPNGPADTATFSLSAITGVSLSATTEVEGIIFDSMASAFTITASPGFTLTLSGTGITNNSGITQNFVTAGSGAGNGVIQFTNSATAGSQTVFTNNGGTGGASFTFFRDSSTAGSATIINNSLFASNGITGFFNSATAANATITNNGGTVAFSAGGATQFSNSATAGNATITNNGGTVVGASGGFTQFFDSATAGNATITNGAGVSGANGGFTQFFDSATAGSATINNNGSAVAFGGGTTDFFASSTAGSATINNEGGAALAGGGLTQFFETSTAGTATINNNGGTAANAGGVTVFADSSSAGSATINANGSGVAGGGGFTNFVDTSTAGNATLIANGGIGAGGTILFIGDSTGGTARVEVFGNGNLDISFHNTGVTIGSLEGDGDVFLGGNVLFVGSNNLDTTFAGVIQDGGLGGGTGGTLSKIGTGALELTSDNTHTGGTVINDGTLVVGSLNALGAGNVILNGGTLQTQNENPRTFNVADSYIQNGGTLRLQLGSPITGLNNDLMVVQNSFGINAGELFLHRVDPYLPSPGDRITVIETTLGTVNGTFDAVNHDFPGLIQPVADYFTDRVDVVFELTPFTSLTGLTRNQFCVAENLDDAATFTTPEAVTLVTIVGNLPIADLPEAFDLIGPEELASIYEISFSHAILQGANFQRRLSDIRASVMGFNQAITVAQTVTENYSGGKGAQGKAVVDDKKAGPVVETCPERGWGVFATGYGQAVDVNEDDPEADGYDIRTGGFTTGVDYRTSSFAVGIGGGYARSAADLVNDGEVHVDTGYAGLYATMFTGGFYLDMAGTVGWNTYDTSRFGLGGFEDGDADGAEFNGLIGGGYDWRLNGWTMGPWATFQYTYVEIDSFEEDGGSVAPLHFPDQSEEAQRSALGLRLAYEGGSGGFIFRPEVRVAWQHEFGDRNYAIDWSFRDITDDHICSVFGPSTGEDSALVDAGITLIFGRCRNFAAYAFYDGNLGREDYERHAATGGFRFNF